MQLDYASEPKPVPQTTLDLVIVGAGPQALTLVAYLLQKRAKFRDRFVAFDPSGTWLSQWRRQMAAQEIEHLRSPAAHHPDPNPFALRKFAENRPNGLFAPYDLPGTRLFEAFCSELIRRWDIGDRVYPAKVVRIVPQKAQHKKTRFQIVLDSGATYLARRVAIATGGGIRHIPDWAKPLSASVPKDQLCHGSDVDLRNLQLASDRILIVGGGLSSGHLALGAAARGAKVTLLLRRQLQEKLFDAEPGWLGPKYLKAFQASSDWQYRWQLIRQARNGGSMTPEVTLKLRRLSREGRVTINEFCEVKAANWHCGEWQMHCNNGSVLSARRIWLATGQKT